MEIERHNILIGIGVFLVGLGLFYKCNVHGSGYRTGIHPNHEIEALLIDVKQDPNVSVQINPMKGEPEKFAFHFGLLLQLTESD